MSEAIKEAKVVEEPRQCKKREMIGPAIGVIGHDGMNTFWNTLILPFMTDVLVLPAAFMGILLAVVRIFDGITDVAMGFIADTTKSKLGRYRVWVLRSGPLFGICMVLSFLVPSDDVMVKCVFAGLMYFITGSIAFTSVDIPFWSLPAAMTSNVVERGEIMSFAQTVSNAIGGIVGIVIPLALAWFGGSTQPQAYLSSALIVALVGIPAYLICFGLVREHVKPDPHAKFSVKLALKNIYMNKPLLVLQITNIFILFAIVLKSSFNFYYCQYNLGKVELWALLSLVTTICMVGGALIFSLIAKFVGKKKGMFGLVIIYSLSCAAQFFLGYHNVISVFVCHAISTLCVGAASVAVNTMMLDTIEYGEWKTGQRNEGLITATRCFLVKFVFAFVGVIVAAVIGVTGYTPGVEQSLATLNSFHFWETLGCALSMIIAVIPLFFYNLTEKRHAEIMAELAARKAAKSADQ